MKKIHLSLILFAVLFLVATGCAVKQPLTAYKGAGLEDKVRSGLYTQKTDNFLVILDSSGSLSLPYKEQTKLNIAKDIVNRMNRTIPEMKLTGALRTFGMTDSAYSFRDKTDLLYGVTEYSTADFESSLDGVWPPNGRSPLGLALTEAGDDLAQVVGTIAVMVVSDAVEMNNSPVEAAKALKDRYGDRLCIYTMHIGDNSEGKLKMDMIAKAGECGFAAVVDDLATEQGMTDFVTEVFFDKTGRKYVAPKPGDSDGDGVFDDKDDCPNTPKMAKVNLAGCWTLKGLNFDYDKSEIKPMCNHLLDDLVRILENNPEMKLEIQGHTDNRGGADYNKGLSKRRAEAVRAYLVGEGIGADRLSTAGYGFDKPAATNATSQGRAENRRVELNPLR